MMRAAITPLLMAVGALASVLTLNESYVPMTTSTVYLTSEVTFTHCGALSSCQVPTITVVTLTTAISTTVCPVTEVQTAGTGVLSFLLPSPSVALSIVATPYASPVGSSQPLLPTLSILTLSAVVPASESTVATSESPFQPPGYSILWSSGATGPLTLGPSTTTPASASASNGPILSISLLGSASVLSPPPYQLPSILGSLAASPITSSLLPVITSVPLTVSGATTSAIGISSVITPVGASPTLLLPPVSLPGYASSPLASFSPATTETQTISSPRNMASIIGSPSSASSAAANTLPMTGASTIHVTAPNSATTPSYASPVVASNATIATSAYPTPSLFFGDADMAKASRAAIFTGFLTLLACLLG